MFFFFWQQSRIITLGTSTRSAPQTSTFNKFSVGLRKRGRTGHVFIFFFFISHVHCSDLEDFICHGFHAL